MKILLVDFNDSFTAILAQSLALAYPDVEVLVSNIKEIEVVDYSGVFAGLVLGPGPGHADAYPEAFALLEKNAGKLPVLGICLGHQIIASFFGATLVNLNRVFHGERAFIKHWGLSKLFDHVPETFYGGLYHSWVVGHVPDCLETTSLKIPDNYIMSLRHRALAMEGVQFHPESYMTAYGKRMLRNWLGLVCNTEHEDFL